ncbi:MAG: flavoprotein, partial [Pelobium sp.]
MLKGKNILLGVCGSIASYKSAELVRLFVKAGANVKIVMTQEATSFITPLTLSTLSKNPVYSTYYHPETGEWNNHVALGLWADFMLIAPA